jgi:hypothetical protein
MNFFIINLKNLSRLNKILSFFLNNLKAGRALLATLGKLISMKKILSLLAVISCCALLFSSCQKDYSLEKGVTQSATGSLWDSTGNCLPDTVIGTFYNGVTPGGDTAYVEIQVNVTQTGSYNINTGKPENGLVFSDSGFFSNTGLNTIRLKPIGTPILNKPTTFNVSFDSTFCSFSIDVQDSTGTGLGGVDTTGTNTGGGDPDDDGNWQFSQGSFTYAGGIDSAKKDNSTGVAVFLNLNGSTSATGDTTMSIKFLIPATDIQIGTYTLTANGIVFSVVDASSLTVLLTADFLTPGTDFTINITSYDAATQIVQGTFSGKAQDNLGNIVTISDGNFTATITQ